MEWREVAGVGAILDACSPLSHRTSLGGFLIVAVCVAVCGSIGWVMYQQIADQCGNGG